MKNIKSLMLFFLFSVLLLFCGCYDWQEIDETAYIIALGIDKSKNDTYAYTFQLANPLEMVSGEEDASGKSSDSSVKNFVIDAPDFYTAKNQLNNFLSKSTDMSHLKLIVFSALLEEGEFLQHSQFLMHEREVRPHTNVAVTVKTAEEFIKSVKPTLEANTAKYYELLGLRSDSLYAPSVTISAFLDQISEGGRAAVLPLACFGDKTQNSTMDNQDFWINSDSAQIDVQNVSLNGMAVFKDGKICGFMNSDCALIFNILSAKINTCTITLKNPADQSSNLVFKLNVPKSAKYSIASTDNKYKITITQNLELEFVGSFLPKGFSTENELYNFAKQVILQKITAFVYDTSRTKAADILNIGDHVKGQIENQNDWQNIFETAEYIVNVF